MLDKILQHGKRQGNKKGNIIYDTDGIAFDERAIGKSVFLTREQAEKALEGRKEK